MPPTKHDEYPDKIVDAYHSIGQQGWVYITKQLLAADDDTITNKIEAINREKKAKMEQDAQRKKLADSKEAVRIWKI